VRVPQRVQASSPVWNLRAISAASVSIIMITCLTFVTVKR
jgi:hypothetical protein